MPSKSSLLAITLLLAMPIIAQAQNVVKETLDINQANAPNLIGENTIWRAYQEGFAKQGDVFVCDNGDDVKRHAGAVTVIQLNQDKPYPIWASATSKAVNVSGSPDSSYSIYMDLTNMDGSHQWGVINTFSTGTHDWETVEVLYVPDKPIKLVSLNLLLRNHAGKAEFKDVIFREFKDDVIRFDRVPIKSWKPSPGFQIRNVSTKSDFYEATEGMPFGVKIQPKETVDAQGIRRIEATLEATDTSSDLCLQLVYAVQLQGNNWNWTALSRTDQKPIEQIEYSTNNASLQGAGGGLARWPFAAVVDGSRGIGLSLDLFHPAHHRTGYNAVTNELYVVYDIALTKEQPRAFVKLAQFEFDGTWGFRGAIEGLYKTFPNAFLNRIEKQGIWMAFAKISEVQDWQDFGFRIKEGNNETDWDDKNDILTFRYTEPMTWWMKMDPELPRTYEQALKHAETLAEKGNHWAIAFLKCGHKTKTGERPHKLLDTPWCNGAVWSINSMPGFPGEISHFKLQWNEKIIDSLYGPNAKGNLDGEYVDSSEGYATAVMDYDREHFAVAQTPLTFDTSDKAPGIHKGLISFEYIRKLEQDVRKMGKLMMANSTPGQYWWLAPLLDVMGTEWNWNRGGKWSPPDDHAMLYRRILCGPKLYSILQNTNFDEFSYECSERYMKRCLFYAFYPSYFSADASTNHYFRNPALYNRDRPLFKKYLPLCKLAGEAGWQPITHAKTSKPEEIWIERYGDNIYTVFNGSEESASATISFDKPVAKLIDQVSGKEYTVADKSISITLDSEDVMLLQAIE